MTPFLVGHATHPEWSGALGLVAAQLDAQLARRAAAGGAAGAPTLGFVYFTDAYAAAAEALLAALRKRWPGVAFVGTVGLGVAAGGVEYFDEPALVVMLAGLPREQFQVFNGAAGLRGARANASASASASGFARPAAAALVHADPATPELPELLAELADRTSSGYLFGGLSSARERQVQIADGVFQGGLSGVAFSAEVALVSRVTQGCTPLGPPRRITASDGTVVLELDSAPALPQLLADLHVVGAQRTREQLRSLVPRLRRTLAGLTEPVLEPERPQIPERVAPRRAAHGNFGEEVRVRHLVGIDPGRQAFAVAESVRPGMGLTFCERDAVAARRDLVRMCTEIRDEIETRAEATRMAAGAGAPLEAAPTAAPTGVRGAVYVSCTGRGGAHFGGPSAEMQIVRHALGDVPLVGFFAAGEIAHRQLYGYTGVLTVWA